MAIQDWCWSIWTIGEVHGYAKQAAAFGYSGVRGLNALLATISTPSTARVIGEVRAPSTMGHVPAYVHALQLAAVNRRLLDGLVARQTMWQGC